MQKQNYNLYVAGISCKCAKTELVGKCALSKDDCTRIEKSVLDCPENSISEFAILSTCNRFETYFVSENDSALDNILVEFSKNGKPADEFKKNAYLKSNTAAITHLFEVSSGLQSQMVGETEILGQVKAAYARACQAQHCKAVLNAVFQKAAQCAKWIRTNTDIGHGKISLGSVSAELAARIFEDISKAKILLVGSGEAGRLVADALFVRGAVNITVVSRTRQKAEDLAQKVGVEAADMKESLANLQNFDIVICASLAPYNLITLEMAKNAVAKRAEKSMFLIDLGVPANIEPRCAEIDNVFLYTLADLSKIANENIKSRLGEIESAKKEILRRAANIASRLWQ